MASMSKKMFSHNKRKKLRVWKEFVPFLVDKMISGCFFTIIQECKDRIRSIGCLVIRRSIQQV